MSVRNGGEPDESDNQLFFDGSVFIASTMVGNPASEVSKLIIPGSVEDDQIEVSYNSSAETLDILVNSSTTWSIPFDQNSPNIDWIQVFGNEGDDTIVIDPGVIIPAEIFGGTGDDSLEGGAGNDILLGNEGDDVLKGNAGDDVLHGNKGNDQLYGDSGDDSLYGEEGDDQICGDLGDDIFFFEGSRNLGNDTLNEPTSGGTDTIDFSGIYALQGVTLSLLCTANQRVLLDGSGTMLSFEAIAGQEFENVIGSKYDDHIYGNNLGNILDGKEGDDSLFGGAGNDILYGRDGDDKLDGGAGEADKYYGGTGFDTPEILDLGDPENASNYSIDGFIEQTGSGINDTYYSYASSGSGEGATVTWTFRNLVYEQNYCLYVTWPEDSAGDQATCKVSALPSAIDPAGNALQGENINYRLTNYEIVIDESITPIGWEVANRPWMHVMTLKPTGEDILSPYDDGEIQVTLSVDSAYAGTLLADAVRLEKAKDPDRSPCFDVEGIVFNDANGNGTCETEFKIANESGQGNHYVVFAADNSEYSFNLTGWDQIGDNVAEVEQVGFSAIASSICREHLCTGSDPDNPIHNTQIGFVTMNGIVDMNPGPSSGPLFASPSADIDANGLSDVREVITDFFMPFRIDPINCPWGIMHYHAEDWPSYQENIDLLFTNVYNALVSEGVTANDQVEVIFLSGGGEDTAWMDRNGDSEFGLEKLRDLDCTVNVRAIGIGPYANMEILRKIDSDACLVGDKYDFLYLFNLQNGFEAESGLAGQLVYVDHNNNHLRDIGEPTCMTDDKGRYVFSLPKADESDTPPTYTICIEESVSKYILDPSSQTHIINSKYEEVEVHDRDLTVEGGEIHDYGFNFALCCGLGSTSGSSEPDSWNGTISGKKFLDIDGDGISYGNELVNGSTPEVVIVADCSGSTSETFLGRVFIGDQNRDGSSETIIDAEIAAIKELNAYLQELGTKYQSEDVPEVGLVWFSNYAIDYDEIFNSIQPLADGLSVINCRSEGGTNFSIALQAAIAMFGEMDPAETSNTVNPKNLIFLSDGYPNTDEYNDEAVHLVDTLGVNIWAFGVGRGASLTALEKIVNPVNPEDPEATRAFNPATIFLDPADLVDTLSGKLSPIDGKDTPVDRGLSDWVIYLYRDEDGDSEVVGSELDTPFATAITDANGDYSFTGLMPGVYRVREKQTVPYRQTGPNENYGDNTHYQIVRYSDQNNDSDANGGYF